MLVWMMILCSIFAWLTGVWVTCFLGLRIDKDEKWIIEQFPWIFCFWPLYFPFVFYFYAFNGKFLGSVFRASDSLDAYAERKRELSAKKTERPLQDNFPIPHEGVGQAVAARGEAGE